MSEEVQQNGQPDLVIGQNIWVRRERSITTTARRKFLNGKNHGSGSVGQIIVNANLVTTLLGQVRLNFHDY